MVIDHTQLFKMNGYASLQNLNRSHCYDLLFNKDLWILAYNNLKKRNHRLLNQLSIQTIDKALKQFKECPLNFVMKNRERVIAEEVIRMILLSSYRRVFSVHALRYFKKTGDVETVSKIKQWNKFNWCLKGEIHFLLKNIDWNHLIKIINKTIKDRRLLTFIKTLIKNNVLNDRIFIHPLNDIPHGGIVYPILLNIYLNELDLFINKIKNEKQFGKIDYVRYGTDFIIGTTSKSKACDIYTEVRRFLKDELKLRLHDKSYEIKHLNKRIRFLGYDFQKTVRHNNHQSEQIKLYVPREKIQKYIVNKSYGNLDNMTIAHRQYLVNETELTILKTYHNELIYFCRYYKLADHIKPFNVLLYFAQSSFLKTIAFKRRSTVKKVALEMRKHKQGYLCIRTKNKKGEEQLHPFMKMKEMKRYLV